MVHELLTALKLAPAVLVGHSSGGTLALGVARRYPQDVASLILVAPAAGGLRSNTMDVLQAASSGSVGGRWYARSSTQPSAT